MATLLFKARGWLVVLALFLVTVAVFSRVLRADFVLWDDNLNINDNPNIRSLDWPHLRWMFTDCSYMRRYVPVSWLNWAVLYHFWGLNPLAFHTESLLLHAINAILVFWLIRKLLRAKLKLEASSGPVTICSGLAALLWAVHPLRVEAVAWANCEMYPQSFFFLLLALLSHFRAVDHVTRLPVLKNPWYWFAVFSLPLSLLTYPIGLAFVAVLLVLDVYPLARLPTSPSKWIKDVAARRALMEKLPFVLVTVVMVSITLWAQMHATGIWKDSEAIQHFGWDYRFSQACYIWAYYLWKPFLPFNLCPDYATLVAFRPLEFRFMLSAGLLIGITGVLLIVQRRAPMLLTLWFCHLVLLVPMLGLTEYQHCPCDRYSYVQGILWSVFIALVLVKAATWPRARGWTFGVTLAVAAALGVASFHQTRIWRDSETLFNYMIPKLPDRWDLHGRLGELYEEHKRLDEAVQQFREVLRLKPSNVIASACLARVLQEQGKTEEALKCYEESLRLQPDQADVLNDMAWIRATHPEAKYRDVAVAVRLAERACQLSGRKYPAFLDTLAAAYAEAGRFPEAVATAREAAALAASQGDKNLAAQIEQRAALYHAEQPYREPAIVSSENK